MESINTNSNNATEILIYKFKYATNFIYNIKILYGFCCQSKHLYRCLINKIFCDKFKTFVVESHIIEYTPNIPIDIIVVIQI